MKREAARGGIPARNGRDALPRVRNMKRRTFIKTGAAAIFYVRMVVVWLLIAILPICLIAILSTLLIRLSALRSGVLRTSSKEFSMEVEWVLEQIGELLRQSNQNAHTTKLKMELKDGKQ